MFSHEDAPFDPIQHSRGIFFLRGLCSGPGRASRADTGGINLEGRMIVRVLIDRTHE